MGLAGTTVKAPLALGPLVASRHSSLLCPDSVSTNLETAVKLCQLQMTSLPSILSFPQIVPTFTVTQ